MSPEREIDETKGGKPDEKIVDARDHVRIIVREFAEFMASMRRSSRSSMNGPFLDERDT